MSVLFLMLPGNCSLRVEFWAYFSSYSWGGGGKEKKGKKIMFWNFLETNMYNKTNAPRALRQTVISFGLNTIYVNFCQPITSIIMLLIFSSYFYHRIKTASRLSGTHPAGRAKTVTQSERVQKNAWTYLTLTISVYLYVM